MVDESPITKRCPRCEQTKPLEAFHRCKTRPDGRNVYCRDCHSVWAKAHHLKRTPERRAEITGRQRALRQAKGPEYYEKARPSQRVRSRRFRERHVDAELVRIAEWAKANPEKRAAKEAKRRAIKAGSGGSHTADDVADIYKNQKGRCAHCRIKLGKKYHVDHIKPLNDLGSNGRRNIQLLCAPCNLSKGAKDPLDFARKLGRLI